MKSRAQSVGKEAPLYPDNEDAWRADDISGLWAVADGAGGTGVYAGEWAQHLVQHLPSTHIRNVANLTDWLDVHWESFFSVYHAQARANYLIEQKFMEEGSCATLTSLHVGENQLNWMVYGDAIALCFRPETNELWASTTNIHQFDAAPCLINWQMPLVSDGFLTGSWQHQPGQHYALLSDALGQYVLMAYAAFQEDKSTLYELAQQPTRLGNWAQAHSCFWETGNAQFQEAVWYPLYSALASSDRFLSYTQRLRHQQLLGSDDYTCILITD